MYKDIALPRRFYNTEEHKLFAESIKKFMENEVIPHYEEWSERHYATREVWKKAGDAGLLGVEMPEKYGGSGLDFTFAALAYETGALVGSGYGGPAFIIQDLCNHYILNHGTEDLKQRYLIPSIKGDRIIAICMTEPSTGSDLQGIQSNLKDDGDHYILNGQKMFITNGYLADTYIVAAKSPDGGLTLIIVDADMKGVEKGKPFRKIGQDATDTSPIYFDNVRVPKANIVGDDGGGLYILMRELARERAGLALAVLGSAEAALDETIRYVNERHVFGKPVKSFQNTQFKLAELGGKLVIQRCFLDCLIEGVLNGTLAPEPAFIAKQACTDLVCEIVDECLQFFGGYGYMWEYKIARIYADSRVHKIYAGTNEVMKLVVARKLLEL